MLNSPKIIKLDIDEFDLESGVDCISIVQSPAIELPFMYFKEQFESYSDYPKQAQENAKIALRWADENGWGSCGTSVGKQRANQLAKGAPISEETISRINRFACPIVLTHSSPISGESSSVLCLRLSRQSQ